MHKPRKAMMLFKTKYHYDQTIKEFRYEYKELQ